MSTLAEPVLVLGEPAVAGWADLLGLASLLLGYPDEQLCAARDSIAQALDELPVSSARDQLRRFTAWWVGAEPEALQRHYVEVFDTRHGAALYVTYLTHQDSLGRGQALYDYKELYRSAGWVPHDDELPDWLPTICQFAALAPTGPGLQGLAWAAEGVAGIERALRREQSPYAFVLAGINEIIQKGGRR